MADFVPEFTDEGWAKNIRPRTRYRSHRQLKFHRGKNGELIATDRRYPMNHDGKALYKETMKFRRWQNTNGVVPERTTLQGSIRYKPPPPIYPDLSRLPTPEEFSRIVPYYIHRERSGQKTLEEYKEQHGMLIQQLQKRDNVDDWLANQDINSLNKITDDTQLRNFRRIANNRAYHHGAAQDAANDLARMYKWSVGDLPENEMHKHTYAPSIQRWIIEEAARTPPGSP